MILFFDIIAHEKIWGGNQIQKLYPINQTNIGEIWGISAHSSHSNTIKYGFFKGKTLADIYQSHHQLFGFLPLKEFPILIKLISANDNLSIQVHPSDFFALQYENSLGKEECWYIIDSNAQSQVIIGHNAKSRIDFERALKSYNLESILKYYSIKKGDFFYIKSGTIHAICKNSLILEVSQSSNITYRLYDYNRLENGHPRALHIEKSLSVMSFPDDKIIRTIEKIFFDFIILELDENRTAHVFGDYFYVIEGTGHIDGELFKVGDFFMVSSMSDYALKGCFRLALINIVYPKGE